MKLTMVNGFKAFSIIKYKFPNYSLCGAEVILNNVAKIIKSNTLPVGNINHKK